MAKTYKRFTVKLEENLYDAAKECADSISQSMTGFVGWCVSKGVAAFDEPLVYREKKRASGRRAKVNRSREKYGRDISDLLCGHGSHGDYMIPAKDCKHLEMHWRQGQVHDRDFNEIPWEENDEG